MLQPQAVIFDIGNVLIEWNPERFYDAQLGEAARRRLFAETDLHEMNLRIDAGAAFEETVQETARAHPQWSREILWWHDNWIDLASPRIDHSIHLLHALRRKGVAVFALSNFGDSSFAYAQTQYDFLRAFDRFYISGRMGAIKPDPQIYAMVEADCGLPPDKLIFTDDKAENIAAAAARGWKTHLFDGPGPWAARLVAEGLLTRQEAHP